MGALGKSISNAPSYQRSKTWYSKGSDGILSWSVQCTNEQQADCMLPGELRWHHNWRDVMIWGKYTVNRLVLLDVDYNPTPLTLPIFFVIYQIFSYMWIYYSLYNLFTSNFEFDWQPVPGSQYPGRSKLLVYIVQLHCTVDYVVTVTRHWGHCDNWFSWFYED